MGGWKFHKLEIKGKSEGIGATTHENTYGERFTVDMLQAMVRQTNGNLVNNEHQYDKLPIGRIMGAELVQMPNNEMGCKITMELYISPDSIKSKGLSVSGTPAKKTLK